MERKKSSKIEKDNFDFKKISKPNNLNSPRKSNFIQKNSKQNSPLTDSSTNFVGFKQATIIKSPNDYQHLKNLLSSKNPSERAALLLQNLTEKINLLPIDKYDILTSQDKYILINNLIEIHSFIWNELTLQIKEISIDYATLYIKMKDFIFSLYEKYPELISSYENTINQLNTVLNEKNQQIDAVLSELDIYESKNEANKELIIGMENEILKSKKRKHYYKQELNNISLEIDQLKSENTELRCEITKLNENLNKYISGNEKINEIEIKIEKKDISCETDPVDESLVVVTRQLTSYPSLQSPKTSERFIQDIKIDENDSKTSSLRLRLFSFMIKQPQPLIEVPQTPFQGEFKKFFWVYPKICSIFLNGLNLENSSHPFENFDQLIKQYLTKHYHTSYLIQQIKSSLIQTSQILEPIDLAIKLFNMFYRSDYDFQEFRFFHTVLEFSIGYSSPDISEIISNDGLTPDQAFISIPLEKAQYVYKYIFPFWNLCNELDLDISIISYWEFLQICIKEFNKCRNHCWSIIKNTLYLSDCSDLIRIPQKNFYLFLLLLFPNISVHESKQFWKSLLVRLHALGKKSIDIIDFESLLTFCFSRDNFINIIMKKSTSKNFSQMFFDWNASVLTILHFLVSRITEKFPFLLEKLIYHKDIIEKSRNDILNALLNADITNGMSCYRKFLHDIDGILLEDFEKLTINNSTTLEEINNLLNQINNIEKVVGIEK